MDRIQFAAVREDPEIEWEVIQKFDCKRVLLIGSGGCTGFHLKMKKGSLDVTFLDPNTFQLELIKDKIKVLNESSLDDIHNQFDVCSDNHGLMSCGIFESFFKTFRSFIHAYIIDYNELRELFLESSEKQNWQKALFSNSYWPIAFDTIFNDTLLNEMFTTSATQFAVKGSYPQYFRQQIEAMFYEHDTSSNYFLHHIFLGHYFKEALPSYLQEKNEPFDFVFINDFIEKIDPELLATFDLIHLSNIYDWMPKEKASVMSDFLKKNMKVKSLVTIRQLNNKTDLKNLYFDSFQFHEEFEDLLLQNDRSGFYQQLNIGQKIEN